MEHILIDGSLCPSCHYGSMMESEQRDDDGRAIYLSCSECDTVQMTYLPLPHQNEFHADPAKFKGFFGGRKSHSLR